MPPKRLTRGKVRFKDVLTGFHDVLRQLAKFDSEAISRIRGKDGKVRTRKASEGLERIRAMIRRTTNELDGSWCEDFEAQYDPPEPPPERRDRGGRSRGGRPGRRG
jgi:hypothetical protein